jgi:hypothetical protein
MCTFFQNSRCGTRNGCGRCNCHQNTCGCTTNTVGNTCGCTTNTVGNTCGCTTGTFGNTNWNLTNTAVGTGCCRYLSFPVSGTAYVPTSAVYFCANYVGTNGNTVGNTNGNAVGTGGGNCCGFGRCGGARAISNYYEDYYARQYGLND